VIIEQTIDFDESFAFLEKTVRMNRYVLVFVGTRGAQKLAQNISNTIFPLA
jgi:hypothetical protein